MIVGIDASNIRAGGGVTHLVELLAAADPARDGFRAVVVWSRRRTLDALPDRPWLAKCHLPIFERTFLERAVWQRVLLSRAATAQGCSVLFIPGGSYRGSFRPVVSMCQNMLPFEMRELRRYGISRLAAKLLLLRFTQADTFRRSDGVIFLTDHAQSVVQQMLGRSLNRAAVIPHGVGESFRLPSKPALPPTAYSLTSPFRVLYVSIVDVYKHQCEVVRAAAALRVRGCPIRLQLVGAAYGPELRRLRRTIAKTPGATETVEYVGRVSYTGLPAYYDQSDLVVFASTCENLPIILMESMYSGRPVICSNKPPMPQVLGDDRYCFDAEDPDSIAHTMLEMFENPPLRAARAAAAQQRVAPLTWQRCARETFAFLRAVAGHAAESTPAMRKEIPA